ncbi:MAG: hypothetical protein KBT47_05765, partial [Armatimonadetes bacterium]|nr:hypothetical protein [Candidatus Hippobium faecium]
MSEFVFKDIENKSWHKLLSEKFPYRSPRSVGMRCQPPHSQFFMQPCPSMGLMALPVYDNFARGIMSDDFDIWKKTPTYYIGFAFGEEPSLANIYQTRFERIDGKTPVIQGVYYHNGIKYTFTYYSNTYKKHIQDTTTVLCKIENLSTHTENCTVRMKPYFINMNDFLFSHYVSYIWDTSKWSFEDTCSLKGDYIFLKNKILSKIRFTDMNYELEDRFISNNSAQRHLIGSWKNIARFSCAESDNQILKETVNTVKFSKELNPGESAFFKLNFISNYDETNEGLSLLALNTD